MRAKMPAKESLPALKLESLYAKRCTTYAKANMVQHRPSKLSQLASPKLGEQGWNFRPRVGERFQRLRKQKPAAILGKGKMALVIRCRPSALGQPVKR